MKVSIVHSPRICNIFVPSGIRQKVYNKLQKLEDALVEQMLTWLTGMTGLVELTMCNICKMCKTYKMCKMYKTCKTCTMCRMCMTVKCANV